MATSLRNKFPARAIHSPILSALAVQEAVAAGRLLQFELDETPVRRSIYMARRRKSALSDPARTFAELVRKQAKASV